MKEIDKGYYPHCPLEDEFKPFPSPDYYPKPVPIPPIIDGGTHG